MNLDIRPFTADDLPGLRTLFRETYGHERPYTHDKWCYSGTPSGPVCTIVAEDLEKKRLAGSYTLLPLLINLNNEVVKGALSIDTMIHPDFQRQGLFLKLAEGCFTLAKKEGVDVLFGFPNNQSYHGFVYRLNWDHTGDIPCYKCYLRPFNKLPRLIATPLQKVYKWFLPSTITSEFIVKEVTPNAQDLKHLLQAYHSDNKGHIRIHRTPEWLFWRYAPESERGYQWLTSYAKTDGNPIKATAVWRSNDIKTFICELIGDQKAKQALLSTIIKLLMQTKARVLITLTNEPGDIQFLKQNRFIKRGHMPLIVRKLTTRTLSANVHLHESWRIMGGDVDVL